MTTHTALYFITTGLRIISSLLRISDKSWFKISYLKLAKLYFMPRCIHKHNTELESKIDERTLLIKETDKVL